MSKTTASEKLNRARANEAEKLAALENAAHQFSQVSDEKGREDLKSAAKAMTRVPFRWARRLAWVRYHKRLMSDAKLREDADYVEDTTGRRPTHLAGPHGARRVPKRRKA